jgi:MYXO-CTERM domain-containing protein
VIKSTGVITLLGLYAGTAAASPRQAFTSVNGVLQRGPHGCGTPQVSRVADPLALPPVPALGQRTVYLNRFGGMYTVGSSTDSAANRVHTDIIEGNVTSFTIPPLDTATFNWPLISACVRSHFRQFDIRVVETEPVDEPYIEAIVGGDGQEIGFGPSELFGIASADNFCNVTEKGIALNFSETHRDVPRRDEELCATIAHEVGHLLALEHEQLPADILSYVLINDSGTKAFVNQLSSCGTAPQQPNPCYCTTKTTSSYGRLSTFVGLRGLEMIPPTLAIDAPHDVVPPTFDVVVTATDNGPMSDVIVLVDGAQAGVASTAEDSVYTITVRNVSEGEHQLSVIAYDLAANMTRKDVTIQVEKLATGETCVGNEVCAGDICAQSADGNFCTQACEPAADACPDDFECSAVGDRDVCVSTGGGCGCASSRSPGPMILLALGLGAVLRRRRRRPRTHLG